jgi:hypothetical protein
MFKNLILALPKAAQPPLPYPGGTRDLDPAKGPRLVERTDAGPNLHPGDRVAGLGNFGTPTGEIGTVEKSNEDEAVVKWDDDGRMKLRQAWLKKI